MCVIIYKPENQPLPDIETLAACYHRNRHGMGFCTSSGTIRHTMSFSRFCSELGKVDESEAAILHFRLATHGSIGVKNCHPFHDKAHSLFFAHNGVLPIEATNDRTDSETFFKDLFLPMLDRCGWDSKILWDWVNVERGASRFIFMRGNEVKTLGYWLGLNGCFYSNMNWKMNYKPLKDTLK